MQGRTHLWDLFDLKNSIFEPPRSSVHIICIVGGGCFCAVCSFKCHQYPHWHFDKLGVPIPCSENDLALGVLIISRS